MITDQRPRFDPRPVLVGFMVGQVALGQVLLEHFSFHHQNHFTSAPYTSCLYLYNVST